jgi:hypothetical protein
MTEEQPKGVGKCLNDHPGSYGYPTRPEEPYGYCQKCGQGMVWTCPKCEASLPEDPEELVEARFCRHCGTAYFGDVPATE